MPAGDYRRHQLGCKELVVVGDGAMGFWAALSKIYPATEHQRCWVHKTANVLNKLPTSVQPKVKADLHDIWMAETRDEAHKAFDRTLKRFKFQDGGAGNRSIRQRCGLTAIHQI